MNGQTTIEPCAICGEPSTASVVIEEAEYTARGGVKTCVKPELRRRLCAEHATHARSQAGWQERQAAARRAERTKLKADQEELFSPARSPRHPS